MRSHRFFAQLEMSLGQQVQLPKEVSHHCLQVLRYQLNDELSLFNGDGHDYLAKVESIEGKQCTVLIEDVSKLTNESPLKIHLLQGVAKGEKMDLIIQKSVELGVHEFTPLYTERCNVKLDEKRLQKKLQHWQKVAISACEQSGRAFIPTINSPLNLKQLATDNEEYLIYLEPDAIATIKSLQINNSQTIKLFIGPEGGFSKSDIAKLSACNVHGVQLGPRILRTETAGLSCIAILQSQFGDI